MDIHWDAPKSDALHTVLARALGRGHLGHLVMLVGPDQEEISTIASELARVLLCESTERRPCGSCQSCTLSFARHPDYFRPLGVEEGDSGIDYAKSLTHFISMGSLLGGWRVAVIADADRLTTSATNALLKTLEEPPAATTIVLTATSPRRVPKTICSRAMIFRVVEIKKTSSRAERKSESDIMTMLSTGSSAAELEPVLSLWQRALGARLVEGLSNTGESQTLSNLASQWDRIERSRRQARANVNPRLISALLLA